MLKTTRIKCVKLDPNLFKKTMISSSSKTFNKQRSDSNDETTKMYNRLLNMTTEDKNSFRNVTLMRTFLKRKKNAYLNSVNETIPRNYYRSLKKIHSQFDKDLSTEKLYDS